MSAPKDQPPNLKLRLFTCCFIVIVCLLAAFPPTAAAGGEPVIIFVNEKVSVSGNGESWETAFKNLQDALNAAGSHIPGKKVEIWVAAGTYKPWEGAYKDYYFYLKKDVALYGGFAGTEGQRAERNYDKNVTTLCGSGYIVVRANNPEVNETAILDGFTITGGKASEHGSQNGGGMLIENCSPTLENCTFFENQDVWYGGGMYINNGSPKLTNCTFLNNNAFGNNSNLSSGKGGGVYVNGGSPTFTNCTFSGNKAISKGGNVSSYGGGMYISSGNPEFTNCTFSENEASGGSYHGNKGGGVCVNGGNPTFTNCTFSDNNATGYGGSGGNGGGMYISNNSSPTFMNCTFSKNRADNDGDGMYIYSGNPTVTNTIFWGEDSAAGQVVEQSSQLTITYSVVDTDVFPGGNNTNADPKLGPLAANGGPTHTCALLPCSSAIDCGTNTGAPSTDQRGLPRPQGLGYDIGAYEAEVGSLTVIVSPEEAGGMWKIDGVTNWLGSGETALLPTGGYTVIFFDVPGWITPGNEIVTVILNQQEELNVLYRAVPIPVPVQPVPPPVLPSGMNLPDGSFPSSAEPLTTVPQHTSPEQKKQAIEAALQAAGLPRSLTESLAGLLDVDGAGQIYVSDEGIKSLEGLLDGLHIPKDTVKVSLPVFTASPIPAGNTAIVYFRIPIGFIGKSSSSLQAVKVLSSDQAKLFKRVHSVEELADGCSAAVEVDGDGLELKGVLEAEDLIGANSRLALAIKDGGPFDLDGQKNGSATDPTFILEADEDFDPDAPGGSGGCSAGPASPWTLALLAPLAPLALRRRHGCRGR